MCALKLQNDYLDRGEYALSICKLIADYRGKITYEPYETHDYVELGDLIEFEDVPEMDFSEEEQPFVRTFNSLEPFDRRQYEDKSKNRPIFYALKRNQVLESEAFSIAISGERGSGKTTFVRLLYDLLNGRGIVYDDGPRFDEMKLFIDSIGFLKNKIFFYKLFPSDSENSSVYCFLERLFIDIFSTNKGYSEDMEDKEEYLKRKAEYARKCYVAKVAIKEYLTSSGYFSDHPGLSNESSYIDSIRLIREELRMKICETSQKIVVVIIDELDKCKPHYVIQLLETIKYIFNIPGIIFIFALDIIKLQHCVKTVYGNEFDAIEYIDNCFDYTSLLPKGSEIKWFEMIAKKYEIPHNVNEYYQMCKSFNLTPREMNVVCSSFYYLYKYQLDGYPTKAKYLYFYLLLLKHRYPDKILSLSASHRTVERERERIFADIPQCLCSSSVVEQPFLKAVVENRTIEETTFYYMREDGECMEKRNYDFNNPIHENGSLSFIIYAADYDRDIGGFRVLEYLFSKVEAMASPFPSHMTLLKKDRVERGAVMTFGRWHKNTMEEREPIEWIALERKADKVLMVSRYIIECLSFHDSFASFEDITWCDCTLRRWLNFEFYENAFNEYEKRLINKTIVRAEKNVLYNTDPGEDTVDEVFLLSIREVMRYLPSEEVRRAQQTPYLMKNDSKDVWWLRNPGIDHVSTVTVRDGIIDRFGCRNNFGLGVRPAIWINLGDDYFS